MNIILGCVILIKLKPLLVSLIIPLGIGGLSAFLIKDSMEVYKTVNQPSFAPPAFLFPIVWSILYVLMGISSYMIYESPSESNEKALTVYVIQLIVNFIWPLIFFNAQNYLLAFIWLILLWTLVLWMITLFYKIRPVAAFLQIPYILWLTFALVLNFSVYLLNS